jgi:hypothetical protein
VDRGDIEVGGLRRGRGGREVIRGGIVSKRQMRQRRKRRQRKRRRQRR